MLLQDSMIMWDSAYTFDTIANQTYIDITETYMTRIYKIQETSSSAIEIDFHCQLNVLNDPFLTCPYKNCYMRTHAALRHLPIDTW